MNYDINGKYYLKKPHGFSPCVLGNDKHGLRLSEFSVLPNCVGFAVGAFNERLKIGSCKYLGSWQPYYFPTGSKAQGLKSGEDPREGAVAVWEKHVAIVEELQGSAVTITESGWNYTKAPVVRTIKYKDLAALKKSHSGFKCFIYPPAAAKDPEAPVYYKIVRGDTLTRIAKKFGTKISAIVNLNPGKIKNPNKIYTGDTIRVK